MSTVRAATLRIFAAVAAALSLLGVALADPLSTPGTEATGVFSEASPLTSQADPSTGAFRTTYSFRLPQARGKVAPTLSVTYNSTVRDGEAGYGWRLAISSIERQPLSGWPQYDNAKDRFAFNGRPLAFICVVGGPNCPSDESFPASGTNARYYRQQVEGSFMRFFLLPSGQTWIVQFKGGREQIYGYWNATLGFSTSQVGVDTDDDGNIFRWHLVVERDQLSNIAVYRWQVLGARGLMYLTDMYDTQAASRRRTSSTYAHHTHLVWESPGLNFTSYVHADRAFPDMRLARVEVASKPWSGVGEREAVRIYRLEYFAPRGLAPFDPANDAPLWGHSFLKAIRMEGRCGALEVNGQLPSSTTCDSLPPVSFEYESLPYPFGGSAGLSSLEGPNGRSAVTGDPYTPGLGDPKTFAVLDLNQDGLPDVVGAWWPPGITVDMTQYPWLRLTHGGFLNQGEQSDGRLRFLEICIDPGPPLPGSLTFFNLNEPASFLSDFGASIVGPWGDALLVWSGPLTQTGYHFTPVAADRTPANSAFCPFANDTVFTPPDPNTPSWVWRPVGQFAWLLSPPLSYGTRWYVDVDGDGYPDLLAQHVGLRPPDLEKISVDYSRRLVGTDSPRAGGRPALLPFSPNQNPVPTAFGPSANPRSDTRFYYEDVNGDGLVDLVVYNPSDDQGTPRVRPGDGRGRFECAPNKEAPGGLGCSLKSIVDPGAYLIDVPDPEKPWPFNENTYFHDVTGDGLADIIRLELTDGTGRVRLWVNQDGHTFRCANPPDCVVGYAVDDQNGTLVIQPARVLFADMRGHGIDDIVVLSQSGVISIPLYAGYAASRWGLTSGSPRPGLLTRIHNGFGATTGIVYQTIQQLDVDAQRDGEEWSFHSPAVVSVVTHIRTVNTAFLSTYSTLPPPFEVDREVWFAYRDPAYDPWDRRFLGFRKVRVGNGQRTDETTYWYGPCQRKIADCPDTSDDDPYGARAGTPVRIDTYESYLPLELGSVKRNLLSTKILDYTPPADLFPSLVTTDRHVRFSYPYAIHTYLYDPRVPTEDGGFFSPSPGDALELPRKQPGRIELLRRVTLDTRGNLREVQDFGRVGDKGNPIDEPIRSSIDYFPCDSSWNCLAKTATTYLPKAFDRQARFSYNPAGNLTDIERYIEGSASVVRFHEVPGREVAKAPTTASTKGWKNLLHLDYDQLGNVVLVRGGGSPEPCTTFEYDAVFLHLLSLLHAHKNGCSSPSLDTALEYDRGLGIPKKQVDPRGGVTLTKFDPFGRPVKVWTPAPDGPIGATVQAAALTYNDGSPLHYVKVDRSVGGSQPLTSFFVFNAIAESVLRFDTADRAAGDTGDWIVRNWLERDSIGRPLRTYRPWFFTGNPASVMAAATSLSPTSGVFDFAYDTYDRRTLVAEDHTAIVQYRYGQLSVDSLDAEQLKPIGPRAGQYQRSEWDGHGRLVRTSRVLHDDIVITDIAYLPTGEPTSFIQRHQVGLDTVTRTIFYDSLGRMVANLEPNTTTSNKWWIYAWDDAGRLVGTSDARGCGANVYYDGLSRPIATDLSPCKASHPFYTPPNLATGDGTEAFYSYDTYEAGQMVQEPGFADNQALAAGTLVSIMDRGAHTRFNYDSRGRLRRMTRRISLPGPISSTLAQRYATHWFSARADYDLGDRLLERGTGLDIPELLGDDGTSRQFFQYSARGTLKATSTSYGPLLSATAVDAAGLPLALTYGDAAGTQSTYSYDNRSRLSTYELTRLASPVWSTPTPTYNLPSATTTAVELAARTFTYDDVNNLVLLQDQAPESPWPDGAKPVSSRSIHYDDLYRVSRIDYTYAGSNVQVSPFARETESGDTSPVPSQQATSRIALQQFNYDWKGNLTQTLDDQNLIYDRSLGILVNGESLNKPNQLVSAAAGRINSHYDETGNLVDLSVERSGTCKVGGQDLCSQRFVFDWDEVGTLARGRRWDYPGDSIPASEPHYPMLPTTAPAWDLEYAYSQGSRVRKARHSSSGLATYTLEVFNTLRVNNTTFDSTSQDYQLSPDSETAYFPGIGRLVYGPTLPSPGANPRHLLLHIGDHLGSTSAVIDAQTGEVVETSTYQAHGAPESDFRPQRWNSFREDYKFTGKEEDLELSISYFGARYYHLRLGTWLSPDPLAIHLLRGDPNPYAYVRGRLANATDSMGLSSDDEDPTPPRDDNQPHEKDTGPDACGTNCWAMTIEGDKPANSRSLPDTTQSPDKSQKGVGNIPSADDWRGDAWVKHVDPGFRGDLGDIFRGVRDSIISLVQANAGPRTTGVPSNIYSTAPALAVLENLKTPPNGRVGADYALGTFLPNILFIFDPGVGETELVETELMGLTSSEGSFTPLYLGYPGGPTQYGPAVPQLRVAARVLEGTEYAASRALANSTNRAIRAQLRKDLGLARGELIDAQIHEIVPVKFGGNPTAYTNKALLTESEHQAFTNWWAELERWVNR
jgi:RHS repeat-associated protein